MARKRFGFKPSYRDALKQSADAQRYYATFAPDDKHAPALLHVAGAYAAIPVKRERAAPRQLEAPVVQAISELLARHPRVLWAARFNSGAASYEASTGRYAPVWFHRVLREPEKTRMPDFFGLVKDNMGYEALNFIIAIEAKAPGWSKPRDASEREQAAFLRMIRDCGGLGLFATSADQVAEALK